MPPPHDGNEYLPFEALIRVEEIGEATYRSVALPFAPGGSLKQALPRAYGGHVYAQSAWAASQTVGSGFYIYNHVGHFLLAASKNIPLVYKVQTLSNGRSYATRAVTCWVQGEKNPCFSGTCSFKKDEKNLLDVQEKIDLWEECDVALRGKRPADFPEVPGMDVPWYWKLREETGQNDKFPGLESRKVDMTPYNKTRHPLQRKGLIFYRPIGHLPSDPNMHLCAHLYHSDRNSLYIVANQMDVGDIYTSMSSLVHTTVFHGDIKDYLFRPSTTKHHPMDDTGGTGRWFCKEDMSLRAASGRAMLHGRVWAADGTHVATITQDGVIRYTKKPEPTDEELAVLRSRREQWPPQGKL